jgi:transposase InsO family protein
MPWKVTNPMNERMVFVSRLLEGVRMTDACKEFGISRKTGYKFWSRYERDGLAAFDDRSRRPYLSPNRTDQNVVDAIVQMRNEHPTWGPRKIKKRLSITRQDLAAPAPSTIGEVLKREGKIKARRRKRRATPTRTPLTTGLAPNDVWAFDFKGHFRLGNRNYCYPLTVSDDFSRFLIGCEALERTKTEPTQKALIEMFREYGLPTTMRSDNGAPFASTGRLGLSQLSVWLLRLGIQVERIEPGHPEQNGRHERIHLTLKQETTMPASNNQLQQQERFDAFRSVYNDERPHDALELDTPADFYVHSERVYPEVLQPLQYPKSAIARRVYENGRALTPNNSSQMFCVGKAFAGQDLGFVQIAEDTWRVFFMNYELGIFDEPTRRLITDKQTEDSFHPNRKDTATKVSPMSPV